ncbi:MAG TPA: methylated-DNA--[protein]-cysteine S-methyltransferase [Vicinamibacteria bacterium]|nr:methylated-DNA--[protein]-cysteine S-methyltransferase [Vicinamibacteria bacterium]
MRFTTIDSPVGPLRLVADDAGLRRLEFRKGRSFEPAPEDWREDPRALAPVARQLQEYFTGRRKVFDLDLAPEGTEFQRRVWERLLEIPYGETISYGTLARRVGNPSASRAVGLANGRNPIAIIIPCHRVIGSNGTLTGYGGGLPTKEKLLELERGQIRLVC